MLLPAVLELQRMRRVPAGRHFHHGPCQVRQRGALEPERYGAAGATAPQRAHQMRPGGPGGGKVHDDKRAT